MRMLRKTLPIWLVGLTAVAVAVGNLWIVAAVELVNQSRHRNRDWPQLGGSSARNNVAADAVLPIAWSAGRFDHNGRLEPGTEVNIRWSARIGIYSCSWYMAGGPTVRAGKIFIGSDNCMGYVPRLPKEQRLSCLLCFREADGKFLWQFASQPLPNANVPDARMRQGGNGGLRSTPYVEADRLWIVTDRDEIVCLDSEGFADGENDGPYRDEPNENADEADIVWKLDLCERFGVTPFHLARSSITAAGDVLFVCTSNSMDRRLQKVPNPDAPSFLALDKNTGQVLWSAGLEAPMLDGQCSSPAVGILANKPQVLFGGGDGWLYSFSPAANGDGQAQSLWKFDCNAGRLAEPKGRWPYRKYIVNSPVIYGGRIYAAIGDDPAHGEGRKCLWCIDPSGQGDVSAKIGLSRNPNSAVVWKYDQFDANGDGRIEFEETMHRSIGSPAIHDDLLMIADSSGLFHCLDAMTGRPHWTHDLLSASDSCHTPLIAGGHVYVGSDEGVTIFKLSAEKQVVAEIKMPNPIMGAPITAGGVLYLQTRSHLFAIAAPTP